jgi:hypothetical protein
MNLIGLVLNFIGSVIIFFCGFPQPDFSEGVSLGLEDNTPIDYRGKKITASKYDEIIRKKKKIYKKISHLGLILICVGFLLQIINIFLCCDS